MILVQPFFSIWVFSHNHLRITELQEKGKGISLTSHYHFRPLHRHLDIKPGDYCRELTSAYRQQPDSHGEPLVSECKSLTTKLRALGASVMGFMAILDSIDYIKFGIFSNAVDETSVNSSQAFLNVKCQLQFLTDTILNFQ